MWDDVTMSSLHPLNSGDELPCLSNNLNQEESFICVFESGSYESGTHYRNNKIHITGFS